MNFKHLLKTTALTAMLLLAGKVGFGQAILTETFNYATPAYVGGNGAAGTSSNGWTTHSLTAGQTTTVDINDGSLSYTGLKASTGNKVYLFSNANATSRDINAPFTTSSTTIYYSALVKVIDNSQISSTAADYFMCVGATAGTSVTVLGARLGIKSVNSGANYRLSIGSTSGGTGNPTYTDFAQDLSFGTTYLVVVKYDRAANPTVASLWVNPTNLGGSEPAGSVSNSSGTNTFTAFASICLRNSATTPKAYIDEIRVGTTFADVTPIDVDVTSPTATFSPANNATGVTVNSKVVITFDEAIRNLDNSAITDPTSLITLKKTDGSGADVAFTSTIDAAKKVITITPSANLDNNQLYYVAIAPVEDAADNATSTLSSKFTTIDAVTPIITSVTIDETAPYYAGNNITVRWYSANVDFVKIEAWTPASTWVELKNSTDATDGNEVVSLPSDLAYGAAYKVRVSYITTTAVNAESSTFTVRAIASNIAALKLLPDGSQVKLTGEAVMTFKRASRNQKYIQDATAGILIDDNSAIITTIYNVGDGITGIIGTLVTSSSIRQFTPLADPGAATSTNNSPAPKVVNLATEKDKLKDEYESMLVKFINLAFQNPTGNFAASSNYTLTDGTNTIVYRTFSTGESNVIGTPVPTYNVTVTGLGSEFSAVSQINGTFLSHIQSASTALTTTSTYTIDINAGTITGVVYQHNLAAFKGNLSAGLGSFNVYDANGTDIATVLDNTKLVIVTAQDGITKKTYTITRIAPSTVSTLSALTYGASNTSVPNFDPATLSYNVALPFGTVDVPVVNMTTTDVNASPSITAAVNLTGTEAERTATILVTAEDGIAKTTYTIIFSVTPANTDNTLSDLKVAGNTIPGFVSTTTDYTYELPVGTTATPVVTATKNHSTATVVITPATDVTSTDAAARTTTIEVTAQDGLKKTYKIEFNVAVPGSDATLTEIKVDNVAINGFDPLVDTYTIKLAAGTSVIPTVTATTNDAAATKVITPATNLTGTLAERTTTIEVTAENTTTKKTYSVVFYVKSSDATLSNLKYNTTQVPSFDAATLSYNVELPYGSSIPTIEATKNFAEASVLVENATNLKGTLPERTATITVTAEDVTYTKVYTIVFNVAKSTDATLSDLKYNSTTVADFSASTLKYYVTLPFGSQVPTVTATKNNVDATVEITQATDLATTLAARTATILITAESGATKTYTITFRVDNSVKELFISEYIEGSSNNKAIEIYNPTNAPVDLSIYTLKLATNGGGWSATPQALTGNLAPGDVFVVCHASAALTNIVANKDLESTIAYFNGNDAVGLFKNNVLIDMFGSETSSVNFDVAGVTGAALDHTIVRKPTITKGNTNWASSAGTNADNSEWIVYPQNTETYIGSHNMFAPAPAITTDKTSLPDFGNIVSGTTGTGELSFIVGGVYLSENIVITAPVGFEISTLSDANFVSSSPISLTPVSGIVAPTTIYVKFHPAAIQAYSANITIENGDVTTKNVAVSGTGVATDAIAPSFISGYPALENVGPYTLDVKVKIDEEGFVYFHKVAKDAVAPTADEIKAQGTKINVVVKNTEYVVNVTGLTDNTAYDFYFVAVDNQVVANTSSIEKKQVTTALIPVVTIHAIQYTTDLATGNSPKKGEWVTTSGVVSAIKNGTNGQEGFYIQDAAGEWNGIYVYSTSTVSVTDRVSVTGTVIEYVDAKTELSPVTKVTITEQSVPVYAPVTVTTLAAKDEKYESVLIKVSNATCASGSNGSFIVNDNSGDLTVYKGLFAELALVATKKYDIVGILDDYKPISGTRMYELYPRNLGDITEIVTGIDDNFNSNLTVYPNPFTNEIKFEGVENVKRVVITSITGQVVINEVIGQTNSISTGELNKGMYFVTFINDKGEKSTKKMVKQ